MLQDLAKGQKFIADHGNYSNFISEAKLLHRRLATLAHFQGKEKREVSTRCVLQSRWVPPPNEGIDRFFRLRRGGLEQLEAKPNQRNSGWLDRQAVAWLNHNRKQVAVVDTDKNMGDALVDVAWLEQMAFKQLKAGFVQISQEAAARKQKDCIGMLDLALACGLQRGAITERELKFVVKGWEKKACGVFRILAKIHKDPIASRPLCNGRQAFFSPSMCMGHRAAEQAQA